MSTPSTSSIYDSPQPSRCCKRLKAPPSSRRKNSIRTVSDIPITNTTNTHSPNNRSICCICLESMSKSDIASLNTCQHLYHRDCILSWSAIENACPLCKTRFTQITDISNHNNVIQIESKKQSPSYHIELGNIIWLDCLCTFCGSDDNEHLLLLCDGCDDAAHTYCIGLGDTVPIGDYYCDTCKPSEKMPNSPAINESKLRRNSYESDEEYLPLPSVRKPKKKKRKKKRKRQDRFDDSDGEYIPNIEMDISTKNKNKYRLRMRERHQRHNNSVVSTLIGLPMPVMSHRNRLRKGGCHYRTRRMVVIDQNKQTHLLRFEKMNKKCESKRFNSLANLFSEYKNNIGKGKDVYRKVEMKSKHKRSFKEMERSTNSDSTVSVNAKNDRKFKRMKYNDFKSRKYSSLSQL